MKQILNEWRKYLNEAGEEERWAQAGEQPEGERPEGEEPEEEAGEEEADEEHKTEPVSKSWLDKFMGWFGKEKDASGNYVTPPVEYAEGAKEFEDEWGKGIGVEPVIGIGGKIWYGGEGGGKYPEMVPLPETPEYHFGFHGVIARSIPGGHLTSDANIRSEMEKGTFANDWVGTPDFDEVRKELQNQVKKAATDKYVSKAKGQFGRVYSQAWHENRKLTKTRLKRLIRKELLKELNK